MVYQFNSEMQPNTYFHPGDLKYLVPGNEPQLSPQKRPMVITSKPANGATFVDKVFYSFVRDQASRFCFL